MNADEPSNDAAARKAAERNRKQDRLEAAIAPQGISGWREPYNSPASDYPLQGCDFKKWARYDSLPIEQACFVLLGFEPPPLYVLRFEQDSYNPSREPTWDAPPEYGDALRSLRLSIEHGNLSVRQITEYPYETQHVTWPELVRWARSKGYAIPAELDSIIAKTPPAQSPATPAPVSTLDNAPACQAPARDEKPWLVANPTDPIALHHWYTPARYFARQLVISDSTLLVKKQVLADKVAASLTNVDIYKRGGKKAFDASTVLKAFVNVKLG